MTDSRVTTAGVVLVASDGSLRATNSGFASVGASAAGAITTGVWYYLEVRYTMGDGTAGAVVGRINGVEVFSATGFDSRPTSKTTYDGLRLPVPLGSGAGDNTYDDMYVSTGALCVFKGDPNPPPTAAAAQVWTGAAFVDAPVRTWTGAVFADAAGVKEWDGSAFV